MTEAQELAWLAGLLEGEGCFGLYPNGAGTLNPQVALWMCDEDVVARAVRVGNRIVGGSPAVYRRKELQAKAEWRPQFGYVWSGKRALDLIWALIPCLGERRTERCVQVVSDWYAAQWRSCARCSSVFWADGNRLCSNQCRAANRADAQRRYKERTAA